MKLAILLATYNRKGQTLQCLRAIGKQELPVMLQYEIFLTDDASPDGTVAAVEEAFPFVHVFPGPGNFFWAGGMRNSWKHALPYQADAYLLLNDDTTLFPDAITRLLATCEQFRQDTGRYAIGVGSTKDVVSGKHTYGGRRLFSAKRPQGYLVYSDTEYQECDLANANIMLVPAAIVDEIGILSEDYTHGIADYDYSLRAKRAGFGVVVSPGFLGTCTNDHRKNWCSSGAGISERIRYLYSVKGLAYREYLRYIRKFFPYDLPATFLKLWLKTLFPLIYDTFKEEPAGSSDH